MPLSELIAPDLGSDAQTHDLRRELIHARGDRIPVAVSRGVLRERQNNELGVVVVVRDLRELEELRRITLTNARLAAVGELAAGLAHEINNPVAFVGSNLRLLRDHWQKLTGSDPVGVPEDERALLVGEGRDLIDESLEGVERAAEIVRGVKNFTHSGSSERTPARLEDLIEDCLRMIRPQVGPDVALSVAFSEVPPVLCSPQELKQVFLNLLINAIHAVGQSGSIRIETATSGGMAVVSFVDDGHGIAPEILDRIFDPFFTTKPVGEGTGLGLGIAHQVVTQHGGVITVQSPPGEGASFRVHLPLDGSRGGAAGQG
jgi:signal transduction histidine kinase